METTNSTAKRIMAYLFKDFSTTHTVTSLAKEIKMSRVGIWKVLKKLQSEQEIKLTPVGSGKTSAYTINLISDNLLIEKSLALYLTEEALKQRRWRINFADLEETVDFLILHGSVLYSKQANDIDIICVVSQKKKFVRMQLALDKIQKTQTRKIHAINFTKTEFVRELRKPNKAFIEALKEGVILFGQENFIQFMKKVSNV